MSEQTGPSLRYEVLVDLTDSQLLWIDDNRVRIDKKLLRLSQKYHETTKSVWIKYHTTWEGFPCFHLKVLGWSNEGSAYLREIAEAFGFHLPDEYFEYPVPEGGRVPIIEV